MTAKETKYVLAGLASGPILAALILLVPLGVLTGLNVALDPSLAIDEFAPEEELFVPFILLSVLISVGNARLAWVMSRESEPERLYKVTTERFLADPSSEMHMHGHRGRQLAADFKTFLAGSDDGTLNFGELVEEDYGWKFSINRKDFSELWIRIAHVRQPAGDKKSDHYVLTVAFEPPFLPWRRLAYEPDFPLHHEAERQLVKFLRINDLPFVIDLEPWVDPEPGMNAGPMF